MAALIEHDPAERLSADDMATRREEEFRARALLQAQASAPPPGRPGVCTNCGARCLPLAVYCDEDCRADHQERVLRSARMRRRAG